MDLNETAVFVKVVQAGGFSAAARQLGLPTSTVSTRVARLEKRLGVTLLRRTTRRLALTDAGNLYFRHAAEGLEHVLEAEAAIAASAGETGGLLRVTAPADLGDAELARYIGRFCRAYPKISVELLLTDRYVDLLAEGVDVAIRMGALRESSLIARKVGVARWAPFASRGYLRSAPPLTKPQHLRKHRCVMFTPLGKDHWTLGDTRGSVTVALAGPVIANNINLIRSMVLAGEGVGLLPTYLCRSASDDAGLTRVLPEWHAKSDPVHLVYPRQRFVPPKLRAFVDMSASELHGWFD
jgi:DNA-binding transcriptional LysR family regulator